MHPDISEEKFKLALATDLVIYMILLWTQNSSRDEATNMVTTLMNKWSERISTNADFMKKQIAEQMTEQNENMTEDVAQILLDVNNIENVMMKGEFKSQMREAIFKGLAVIEK
jgi:hypothetical protein